jgi:PKD repeat protein
MALGNPAKECAMTGFLVSLLFLLTLTPLALAQPSFQTSAEFKAVPTFHSLGLYWSPPNKGTGQIAQVEYKVAGAPVSEYKRGLDLWYDLRTPAPSGGSAGEYRGSLVHLQPNTAYDIRLTLSPHGQQLVVPAQTGCAPGASCTRTWNETFPIGNTITIPAGNLSAPFVIRATDSGSASGYTLVTSTGEINGNNLPTGDWQGWAGSCIVIEPGAHHIIFRGLVLRQCKRSGINLRWTGSGGQTSDIVVEDSEFSGFGTNDTDAALHCNYNNNASNEAVRPERVIFQNNKVHNPRISAQSWFHGHPAGPNMVEMNFCNGNHVIRNNELYSTNGNFFKDGLGSVNNFTSSGANWFSGAMKGAPYADSDLYGNVMTHVYDDGFEVEGADRNVRVWGNYFDKVFVAVAQANNAMGPLYVFRNVVNVMGGMSQVPVSGSNPAAPDDEARGPFSKAGGRSTEWRGGRTYYFHNTLLQPPPSACGGINLPCGAGWAMREDDRDHYNFVSHNNLWIIHKPQQINGQWKHSAISASCSLGSAANQTGCTLSHDMYNNGIVSGATVTTPPNWSNVTPTYATSGGSYPSGSSIPTAANDWTGDFTLQSATTGHGEALVLFNFNDQHASPDVGAHQSGSGPMRFGNGTVIVDQCAGTRPTASLAANPTSGEAPLAVSFDGSASSAVSPKTIASYTISYGDGTPSGSGATQNHTYQNNGQYVASLTVTDSAGCTSAPDTEAITVIGGPQEPQTILLMEGLGGYVGTTDASLRGSDANSNFDTAMQIRSEGSGPCASCDSGVIRFAIFQSEGGPVPNGATITSATLSLYQFGGPPAVIKASRLLKGFHEQQVTYNSAASGTPWTTAGANGSGSDYLASADGQGQSPNADAINCGPTGPDPNACWLHINVTSGVQAFSSGTPNRGWKLAQVSSPIPGNYKNFNTSENPGFPNFRPKLTITFTPN